MFRLDGFWGIPLFLLNGFLLFGVHFTHDLPSPLQGTIQASSSCHNESVIDNRRNVSCTLGLGFTPFQYNLLYAVYSISEATTALFAGYLVDKLGRTVTLTLSGCLSGIGAVAFALGPMMETTAATLAVMLLGRLFIAVSNAVLFVLCNRAVVSFSSVVQGVIIVFWFEDRVNSAFGAISSANAAGEVLNFVLTKHLYNSFGIEWTLWIGAIFVIAGTSVLAFLLSWLDVKRTSEVVSKNVKQCSLKLADLLDFPVQYWLLVLTRVCFNSMIWALIGNVSKFVTDKYGYPESSEVPSYFAGIFFGISSFGCFMAGKIMDHIGCMCIITSISMAGSMAALALLAFSFFPPHVCAIVISLFYSFASVSVIACISQTVPKSATGTAVGIALALEMCFTAASNVVIGRILGTEQTIPEELVLYRWRLVIIYTMCLTALALGFSLVVNYCDYMMGWGLNKRNEITDTEYTKEGFQQLPNDDVDDA